MEVKWAKLKEKNNKPLTGVWQYEGSHRKGRGRQL